MLPARLSTLLLCGLLISVAPLVRAQSNATPRSAATLPNNNSAVDNDKNKNNGGCSRADWLANKCSSYPGTPPRRERPIIIIPQTSTPPVDDTPLPSDWEGCRKTKLNQLNLTQTGNLEQAKQLDEWLWKNCRSYSEDLRQLEQDQM